MSPTAPDRLSSILLLEATLATFAIFGAVVPFILASSSAVQIPSSLSPIAWLGLAALGILWILVFVHTLVDGWKVFANGLDLDLHNRRRMIHVGFRVLESLGVLLPPGLVIWFGRSFNQSYPSAPAAVGSLFFVVGSAAVVAVLVLIHAGWQLASG